MTKQKITAKQKAFCEYVILEGKSLVEAYILAGYSSNGNKNTLKHNAYVLYNTETCKAYIAELSAMVLRDKNDVFTKLLLFYIDVVDNEEVPMKERLKASENLAKMYSLLSDSVQIGTKDDFQININIKTPEE